MPTVESVEYDGVMWHRYPESKRRSDREYFKRTPPDGRPVYLHRQVWEDNFGAIPDGWHVHHKDEDCQNNDPANLECLSPAEHRSHHGAWNGRQREYLEHLAKIRPLTKAWHASEEGIEWHRRHGIRTWQNRVPLRKTCDQCGEAFDDPNRRDTNRFCSNKCKSAWRRAHGLDNEQRKCEQCGGEFTVNKYRRTRFCSRSCAQRSRNR